MNVQKSNMKTYVLLTALLLLVGFAPVEAQTTTCTKIGNMVTCDTPTTYPGQAVGPGPALNGFVDGFLRADEQFSRQQPQPPVNRTEQQRRLDEKECPPGYYLKNMSAGCFQGTR